MLSSANRISLRRFFFDDPLHRMLVVQRDSLLFLRRTSVDEVIWLSLLSVVATAFIVIDLKFILIAITRKLFFIECVC